MIYFKLLRLNSLHYLSPITKRPICVGAALRKQPPHDKQRSRRHRVEPRHRLPFVDESVIDRLPRKPASTEHNFNSIDWKLKTHRYKDENRLKELPTTFDKIQELYHIEPNLWHHSLDLPLKCPEMLKFVQQVTRTNLLSMTNDHHQQEQQQEQQQVNRDLSESLTRIISEQWLELNRVPTSTTWDQNPKVQHLRDSARSNRIAAVMEMLYSKHCFSSLFSSSGLFAHLPNLLVQLDESSSVEAFIKRHVPADLFVNETKDDNLDEDLFNAVNETVFDSVESVVRYRIRSQLAWQLRTNMPMKPFISWDDPSCKDPNYEPCYYRPESFDLQVIDCYRFTCLPLFNTIDSSEFARSVAGYWPHSPFWHGDPCEFGYLGVLDVARGDDVAAFIKRTNMSTELKESIWTNHGLSEGLLTAFAWTTAQAYNLGFTLYNELTYPIACQLLLFDNNSIQLLHYQLNSTTSLWRTEDSNLPHNMAWYSPKIPLFEMNHITTSPTIQLNPDALPLLLKSFAQPIDSTRSLDSLRPHLSVTADRAQSAMDRLIPNSSDIATESMGTSDSSSISTMTESERAALEESNKAIQKVPLRLRSFARPHPNDVYFLKLTDKSELVQELQDQFSEFGGQFGQLPEPYQSKLTQWRLAMRDRRPRKRVEAPPRRWR